MKIGKFNEAVKRYKKSLGTIRGKIILVDLELSNEQAFFSIAPLSRAVHELGGDITIFAHPGKSETLRVLRDTWKIYQDLNAGVKGKETSALREFIKAVDAKAKEKGKFKKIFVPPEMQLVAESGGFGGDAALQFETEWFEWRMKDELFETCKKIWNLGYALKKNEKASIGFEVVPAKPELPFKDYLDSYAIARAMYETAVNVCSGVYMGTASSRKTKLEPMLRVDDLAATLRGCEYEKNINEPVFKKFRALSKVIHAEKLKSTQAGFGIHGEGYGGKHFFGTAIGYPTPNKKARWLAPGMMFLKASWHSQTKQDNRMPQTRYAITETLPIENFVRTCNINYPEMRRRNAEIQKVVDRCETLYVKGNEVKGGKTDLKVSLRKWDGTKVNAKGSDSDVRSVLNKRALKKMGVKAGMYDNFPGGECFFTPYDLNGTAVGDTVINVDRSYVIPVQNPLVVKFNKGNYRVLSGPASLIKKMDSEKKDSKKLIAMYRRNKSMPEKLLKTYEKNFTKAGEFAINTNPKAKLSNYLIENEKIARMIHIALGSGFDVGSETMYHWDFVINIVRQKADIYCTDKKGKTHWIIKKGNFVV